MAGSQSAHLPVTRLGGLPQVLPPVSPLQEQLGLVVGGAQGQLDPPVLQHPLLAHSLHFPGLLDPKDKVKDPIAICIPP